jgi:hypothetical protein
VRGEQPAAAGVELHPEVSIVGRNSRLFATVRQPWRSFVQVSRTGDTRPMVRSLTRGDALDHRQHVHSEARTTRRPKTRSCLTDQPCASRCVPSGRWSRWIGWPSSAGWALMRVSRSLPRSDSYRPGVRRATSVYSRCCDHVRWSTRERTLSFLDWLAPNDHIGDICITRVRQRRARAYASPPGRWSRPEPCNRRRGRRSWRSSCRRCDDALDGRPMMKGVVSASNHKCVLCPIAVAVSSNDRSEIVAPQRRQQP